MKKFILLIFIIISCCFQTKAQSLYVLYDSTAKVGEINRRVQFFSYDVNLKKNVWSDPGLFLFSNTDTIRPMYSNGLNSTAYQRIYTEFFFNGCTPGVYGVGLYDSTGALLTFPNMFSLIATTVCNAPTIISPSNGISSLSRLLIDWTNETGAVKYGFWMSQDSLFDFDVSYVSTSSHHLKKALDNNSTTYFRVMAVDSLGLASPWSQMLSVTVNATASTLASLTPNITYGGNSNFTPLLSGINTHFIQASSTISYSIDQVGYSIPAVFPQGTFMNIPNDEEINTATFAIPINAPIGYYNVNLYDQMDGAMTIYNGLYISDHFEYSGRIYFDLNANNIFDAGDIPYPNVSIIDSLNFEISDSAGNFIAYRPAGTYTVHPSSNNLYCYTTIPPDYSFSIDSSNMLQSGVDFALTPIPGAHDLQIGLSSVRSNVRVGASGKYILNYSNYSPITESGRVYLVLPPLITIDSSSNSSYTISGDTILWNFSTFQVFQSEQIDVYLHASNLISGGTMIRFDAGLELPVTDINPIDNISSLILVAGNSYDPNEKTVFPDNLATSSLIAGEYLQYTIHFQNTGNDTAFNISILDTISSDLDFSSFQLINQSHSTRTIIHQGRVVEFKFDNINLPDSTVDEPLSNGFVTYRIKTNPNLSISNIILNTAYIYFDHNAPVITNVCMTTISVGSDELIRIKNDLKIYPNPASTKIKIVYPFNGTSKVALHAYDITGKKLMEVNYPSLPKGEHELSLDVSGLTNGVYRIVMSDDKTSRSNNLVIEK